MISYINVTFFDRFTAIKKLEETSIFALYLGTDIQSGNRVVIKILNPALCSRYEVDKICFAKEVFMVKKFDHSNIMKLIAADIYANTICAIYVYDETAESFASYIEKKTIIPVPTALNITSQLASALRYAHKAGIWHRNLKPSNISISETEEGISVKLMDFGMSYVIDYMNPLAGDVNMNFGFMAPESTGLLERKVDGRSDLYSLGILLYRILTGRLPFTADSVDNMVYQHVAVNPEPPERVNPDIPTEVSKIVLKLIAKDSNLRYREASELIDDIDRFIHEGANSMSSPEEEILSGLNDKFKLLCRRPELDKVNALCTNALSQEGSYCMIRGDWGSGKSNLFTNFCQTLNTRGIKYFRNHFTEQNSMTPYSAFSEMLDSFVADIANYDNKERVSERARLAKTVSGCTDLIFAINRKMEKFLPPSQTLPVIDSYKEQQRNVKLLASFFLSLYPKDKPYVLLLGDIHHADPASLSLIAEMVTQLPEHRVFMISSYRDNALSENEYLSNFLKTEHADFSYDDVPLAPFDANRMCGFLSELLTVSKENCRVLADYVLEKTEGNPYFALNFVRSLLEEGVISIHNGLIDQDWDALRNLSSNEDMTDIITRRMESLSQDCIDFLEIAAVVGQEFSIKLMSAITDLPTSTVFSLVEPAMTYRFIEMVSSDSAAFAHSDIRSVFINRLSEERIKELHYLIAKGIEQIDNRPDTSIYSIVYHLSSAGADSELSSYIMDAARLSEKTNASELAIRYYNKAVKLIERFNPSNRVDWLESKRALAGLNLTIGNFDAAIAAANDLLPYLNDTMERATMFKLIGLAYFRQGKFGPCENSLIDSLELLGEHIPKDSKLVARRRKLLYLYKKLFKNDGLEDVSNDVLVSEKAEIIVSIYEVLCWVYIYTDYTKFEYGALRLFMFAKRNLGNSPERATAISILAIYYALNKKRVLYDAAMQVSMKMRNSEKDDFGIARSTFFSGLCEQWFGRLAEAQKLLEESKRLFEKIGDQWELNNSNLFIAKNLQMLGRYAESKKVCEVVIRDSSKLGDNLSLCQAYSTLITGYTESGSYVAASETAQKATAYVEKLDLPYASACYYLAYGSLLLEQNKVTEACKVLNEGHKICMSTKFIGEYVESIHGMLEIAKIKQLNSLRNSLDLSIIQQREVDIYSLCVEAKKRTAKLKTQSLSALRALALYGIMTERIKLADATYKIGSAIATENKYVYESAKFYYELGCYLLSQHRYDMARFYIFEAYMLFSNISSAFYSKKCGEIISERYRDDYQNNELFNDITTRKNRMNVDRKVNTLLKLGERLTSTLEVEELQKKVLQDAVELVGAERGILFLYPESGEKKLYVAAVFNLGSFDCNTYDWMLEEVEKNRKPIVINDVQSDEFRRHYAVMVRYGIKSVMAMPMFVRGDLFGVIYLDSRLVRQIFSEEYIETMGFIANQAGAPIANARLYHRAITDGLTDLFGRSYLDNTVDDITADPKAKISAIMIDIDFFKKCNDTYGHPFGDKVLKQLAGIMKRVAGEQGIPCRYGGEEFVVLVRSDNAEYVVSMAEKIRQLVESTAVAYTNNDEVKMISVTISLGVSVWKGEEMEKIDLIEHADKALYYAKEHGKNQVVLWTPDLPVEKKK